MMRRLWLIGAFGLILASPVVAAAEGETPTPLPPEFSGVTEETSHDEAGGTPPIDIYGFVDFSFLMPMWREESVWSSVIPSYPSFAVGNINLYLAKSISDRCRALTEVRLLYLPHGTPDANRPGERVNTTAPDHADVQRPVRVGSLAMERVQLDCELHPLLTLRVGQWLTPYGIWNIDHGTPTLIAIRRPYAIGESLFPQRQTGLQVLGSRLFGDLRVGYNATVSNGRGPVDSYRDLDRNKAVGFRLELGWNRFGDLTLGGSYYRGTYTDRKVATVDLVAGESIAPITQRYKEQSFGADLKWDWKGLSLRAEYLYNERAFTSEGRPKSSGGDSFQPDQGRNGFYTLLGYRTPWFRTMPYFLYQHYHFEDSAGFYLSQIHAYHGGLNIQATPTVTVKFEFLYVRFPGAIPIVEKQPFRAAEAQVAWVF